MRSGTRVFPVGWNERHAAVIAKTLPDTCTISRLGRPQSATFDKATGRYINTTVTPLFTGPCRLEGSLTISEPVVGEDAVPTASYEIVLERGAAPSVQVDDVVVMGSGQRLLVKSIERSSNEWETRLGCTMEEA